MKRTTYDFHFFAKLMIVPFDQTALKDDYQSLCRGAACEQLIIAEDPSIPYNTRKKHFELAIANLTRAKALHGPLPPKDFEFVISTAKQHFELLVQQQETMPAHAALLGNDSNPYDGENV